jgi:hypothetical protein
MTRLKVGISGPHGEDDADHSDASADHDEACDCEECCEVLHALMVLSFNSSVKGG